MVVLVFIIFPPAPPSLNYARGKVAEENGRGAEKWLGRFATLAGDLRLQIAKDFQELLSETESRKHGQVPALESAQG
jgi:hypothetical protein